MSSICHSRVLNRTRAPLFTKLMSRKFRPSQKKIRNVRIKKKKDKRKNEYILFIHNYGCKRINLLNANTNTPPFELRNLAINFFICALVANANEPIQLRLCIYSGYRRTSAIPPASQVACNFNLCTNYTFKICFYGSKKTKANLQYLFLFVVVVVVHER